MSRYECELGRRGSVYIGDVKVFFGVPFFPFGGLCVLGGKEGESERVCVCVCGCCFVVKR